MHAMPIYIKTNRYKPIDMGVCTMKRRMFAPLLLGAVMLLSGCGAKEDPNAYEKIHSQLLQMETYEAMATVAFVSNKDTHEYETLQQCKTTGEYRVEVTGPEKVAGNVTIFDGKMIYQFNERTSGKMSVGATEAPERAEIFLTSFVKNYIKSQEVSVSVANMDDGTCTVLEAEIPGGHPYLRTEKLWVDNKTYKPVKLVIYDPDGGERILVTYRSFEYNKVLDDSLFKVASE